MWLNQCIRFPTAIANQELVFSLIVQNKKDFRSALSLLASIQTIKMACEEPSYKYEPPGKILKLSKASQEYVFVVYQFFFTMYIFDISVAFCW